MKSEVDNDLPQVWMKRPPEIDLLPALRTAPDDFQIPRDGAPLLVVHGTRLLVADPRVRATTARVHPHDVLKPEVVPQCCVDGLDGHCHELPAFVADVGLVAACADAVVICQVDIEAQLLREGLEGVLVP